MTFPALKRLLAHRPTRREESLRRSLREQHDAFARVYTRCRAAEQQVTDLKAANDDDRRRYIDGVIRTGQEIEALNGMLDDTCRVLADLVSDEALTGGGSWAGDDNAHARALSVLRRVEDRRVEAQTADVAAGGVEVAAL